MISDFFDTSKPIGRKDFAVIFFIYTAIITLIYYAILYFSPAGFVGSKSYFFMKFLLDIVYLIIFMFPAIKRVKDIGIPVWFLIIFWISYLFALKNIILIKEFFGIEIDPFSIPVSIIMMSGILLSLALFFKSGNHNK